MSDVQAIAGAEQPTKASPPVQQAEQADAPKSESQGGASRAVAMIEIPAAQVLANAGNKTVAVPTSVFKELKHQARQKGLEEGQAKALAEVAVVANKFGYDDATAFIKALKRGEVSLSTPPPKDPPKAVPEANTASEASPAPDTPSSAAGKADKADKTDTKKQEGKTMSDSKLATIEAKWAADVAELRGKVQSMEQATKAAQEALAAKDAEMALRERFIRAGARDADYLTTVLAREINGMDDAAIKTFDESAWLEKQKQERSYLFEAAAPVKPATTGAVGGGTAPSPSEVASATRGAGTFNGRDAKPDEFRARLAQLGLGSPGR